MPTHRHHLPDIWARARGVTAVVGALIAALSLAACGGASGPSLTLYNGQHEATTDAVVTAFEHRTGIHVDVRSGESSELANEIIQEGSASPADVIYTEDSPELTALEGKGLLARLQPRTLHRVPARARSADGRWTGVTARVRDMVYNPAKIARSALPRSVLALSAPRWKGKVGIETTSGSLHAMVTAIRLVRGQGAARRWLEGIKRNAKTFNSHDAILRAVNAGQIATGLMNNYYWYRLRREIGAPAMHARIHYFASGDPGSLLDVSGAAVLGSAPHPGPAQRFVAFLVSRAGQRAIQNSDSFEYPLNPHAPANPALTPLKRIDPLRVSLSRLGRGQDRTLELMRQVGLI